MWLLLVYRCLLSLSEHCNVSSRQDRPTLPMWSMAGWGLSRLRHGYVAASLSCAASSLRKAAAHHETSRSRSGPIILCQRVMRSW